MTGFAGGYEVVVDMHLTNLPVKATPVSFYCLQVPVLSFPGQLKAQLLTPGIKELMQSRE